MYYNLGFSIWRHASRSYHMTSLLPSYTTPIRSQNQRPRQSIQLTVRGRLAWTIGCSEEQLVYMCTKADNQQLLSILDEPVQDSVIILNGRGLLLQYGWAWNGRHLLIWYAP